jgi:diaminopimelate epimerase
MQRGFLKMHGLGNDFAIFDARAQPLAITPDRARALADRRYGIGCDQLIVIEPSSRATAFMRIWNPDGSQAGACGNASRCVAHILAGEGIAAPTIETTAGVLHTSVDAGTIHVAMGRADFAWDRIPLAYAMDTASLPIAWETLSHPVALSIGNPHVVFFVADAAAIDLARLGPLIENDMLFPQRINVNIAQIVSRRHIRHRVWERGAGLTVACGSGACAVAAAAVKRRLADRAITVSLPGGDLAITVADDWAVSMAGPVAMVFAGTVAV